MHIDAIVAPAVDANAASIHKRQRGKKLCACNLVFGLKDTKLLVSLFLEGGATKARATIIYTKDQIALLRKVMIPKAHAAPEVTHSLRAGTTIDMHQHRILFGRIKVSGQK